MGNPTIQARLKTISKLLPQHEDLRDSLELQRKILEVQLGIISAPIRGAATDCSNQKMIERVQKMSLEEKRPIISFLDRSMFDLEVLLYTLKKIVNVFIERNASKKGLEKLLDLTDAREIDLSELVEAILREDIAPIRRAAEKSNVNPSLLLYIISALLQPCIELVARKIDSSLFDEWWQTTCPVCGRIPVLARIRHRKRYLVCTFCGTEYLSDRFLCVYCGNKDPYALKYLSVDAEPQFQIDFCTKCRHYVKVIDEAKVKKVVPKGFEDILTMNLDVLAKDADLRRE